MPFLYQMTDGRGVPDTGHDRYAVWFSITFTISSLSPPILGGTGDIIPPEQYITAGSIPQDHVTNNVLIKRTWTEEEI